MDREIIKMKKIGTWYVPINEEFDDTLKSVYRNAFGSYPVITECIKHIDNFSKAIDIGTWIGDSTDLISRLFSRVYGFEANPSVYACAVKNLEQRQNIELYNIALSNVNSNVEFYTGVSTFSGWVNTLENVEDISIQHINDKFKIESKTLDSYNFTEIDFLKIDADSHEGFILEGSKSFFKNNNPVILIEYKKKVLNRQTEKMTDPIKFLTSIGYEIVANPSKIDLILKRTAESTLKLY